jgi:hypothetical protein
MARALANVLRRVRALAVERRVRFTLKALRELASLGLDAEDACETLEGLRASDFVRRLVAERTGEWRYVFKPRVGEVSIYLKFVLREGCLIVSFHEDENGNDDREESA